VTTYTDATTAKAPPGIRAVLDHVSEMGGETTTLNWWPGGSGWYACTYARLPGEDWTRMYGHGPTLADVAAMMLRAWEGR